MYNFIKDHIGTIIMGAAIVAFLIFCAVMQDLNDREFLGLRLGASYNQIHRQFFHLEGSHVRVYYIDGTRWMVSGLVNLDLWGHTEVVK